jgi:chromosome segregation ATPase
MMLMDEVQQLREEVKRLTQENQELRERLTAAEATIKQLVELLKQNSHNSNWPSSRDTSRRKTNSLRTKSARKAGGQAGHEGHTLEFSLEPDVIEKHRPTECAHCQEPLPEEITASEVAKRQVLDLPPLRYVTTEHQVETVLCPS